MAHSCERQPVFCLDIKKKGGSQSMSLQFIFGNSGSGKSHYLVLDVWLTVFLKRQEKKDSRSLMMRVRIWCFVRLQEITKMS